MVVFSDLLTLTQYVQGTGLNKVLTTKAALFLKGGALMNVLEGGLFSDDMVNSSDVVACCANSSPKQSCSTVHFVQPCHT